MGFLIIFAALAYGAHDLWAASVVYVGALSFASLAFFRSAWRPEGRGLYLPLVGPSILLLAGLGASLPSAINPGAALISFYDWIAAVLVFYAAVQFYADADSIRPLLTLVVFLMLFEAAVNVKGLISFMPVNFFHEQTGTLINANVQAGFMLLWAPVLWMQFRDPEIHDPRWKVFWLAGFLAAIFNIVLCRSASAVACLIIGFAILVPRTLKQRALLFFLVFVAIAVVGWLKFQAIVPGRTGTLTEGATRWGWWQSAIAMFSDFPRNGVGLGNFQFAFLAYNQSPGQYTRFAHSHVLELAAETGVVGLIGVITFYLGWLFSAVRQQAIWGERYGFVVGIALFLLFGWINLSLEYLVNLITLGLFMGITLAPADISSWKPRRFVFIIVLALALAAVPFALSPLAASRLNVAAEELIKADPNNSTEAIKLFESAAKIFPLSFEAERGLAFTLFSSVTDPSRESERYLAALRHQEKAIRLNRMDGVMWWEIGRYQMALGQKVEALRSYRNAAKYKTVYTTLNQEIADTIKTLESAPARR